MRGAVVRTQHRAAFSPWRSLARDMTARSPARKCRLGEVVARRHKAWAAVPVGAGVLLLAATVVSTLAASYFGRPAGENKRLLDE